MPSEYHTDVRLQLLALGYVILPNHSKVCSLKGWGDADYAARELASSGKGSAAERVARWETRFPEYRATGVRLDNRLGAADLDVDDGPMIARLWEIIGAIAPDVAARAPTRFGGGEHKLALFVRIEGEQFHRIKSRKYFRPGEDPATAAGHRVEIFGGGGGAKQFGIYGPHSYNADGTVAREYVWATETPDLAGQETGAHPALTAAQAWAIVGEYEKAAEAAGWIVAEEEPNLAAGGQVYDIDEATHFDTDRAGDGLTYAELCNAFAAHGDLRCATSFIPGRSGTNRTHGHVLHSPRHDCVAVYVYGDEQTHYPAACAPVDPAAFAERLKAAAALHGVAPGGAGGAGGAGGGVTEPNWRERYENGRPKATLHNARLAVEACGLVGSEDVFHGRLLLGRGEVGDMKQLGKIVGLVTDGTLLALRFHLSDLFERDFTEKHVRDAVVALCGERKFNPVVDMLAEAEANWDGVARIDRMAVDFFNCADTPFNRAAVRKTMIAAVARARLPGCKFDTIPVLEAQEGWNKSSAWAVLAGEGNFSDERILGAANKEVLEQLAGVWIHESSEMAGMKKAEVETVKAFASRRVDRARPAYGRFLVEQPRHSIEVGTTNADTYLHSQTGNRRFWPLRVLAPIDLANLRRFRLQLWGEAAALQSGGEALTLPEELWGAAAIEQDARLVHHPWEATLAELRRIPEDGSPIGSADAFRTMVVVRVGDEDRVSVRAIFERALGLNSAQMHRGHAMALSEIMRRLGWTHKQTRIDGISVAGYVRPTTWVAPKGKTVS